MMVMLGHHDAIAAERSPSFPRVSLGDRYPAASHRIASHHHRLAAGVKLPGVAQPGATF